MDIKTASGRVLYTSAKAGGIKDALVEAVAQGADLQGADLRGAHLRDAYLRDAYLRGAYLQDAHLQGAYLQGADLRGAHLRGAHLEGAKGADLVIARTRIIPETGSIIGWKKAVNDKIVKLKIPKNAKRSHAMGRKCRAERAKVLAIFDVDGNSVNEANSLYSYHFYYRVGETVEPTEPFDDDMWNECSSGIHFYITRIEAENHV